MADPLERMLDLAMYLANQRAPVRWDQIRDEVPGYAPGQETDAFLRMFERDKEQLRAAGLEIEVVEGEGGSAYRLDARRTYSETVDLSPEQIAALRAVGFALAADPAFPYPEDLRMALAKLLPDIEAAPASSSRVADEEPPSQGSVVATLSAAVTAGKVVRFAYTNALSEHKRHEVEPYGLFLREGRWYLVGRDVEACGERVYAACRMSGTVANTTSPKTRDFERPAEFDIGRYVGQPFQYGSGEPFEARIRVSPEHAWRAPALTCGAGRLEERDDGSVIWTVEAVDPGRLARWVVENGPGLAIEGPAQALELLRTGLRRAAELHA